MGLTIVFHASSNVFHALSKQHMLAEHVVAMLDASIRERDTMRTRSASLICSAPSCGEAFNVRVPGCPNKKRRNVAPIFYSAHTPVTSQHKDPSAWAELKGMLAERLDIYDVFSGGLARVPNMRCRVLLERANWTDRGVSSSAAPPAAARLDLPSGMAASLTKLVELTANGLLTDLEFPITKQGILARR